jgi:PIN domain nuclease of toxin-antitoxin system
VTVLDTHALVWWLTEPSRLSPRARRAVQASAQSRALVVSAASIFEVATLERRGRLAFSISIDQWLADVRSLPELSIEPVSADIAALAGSFGSAIPGDPIDRLIVATAQALRLTLVSADEQLRAAKWIETLW